MDCKTDELKQKVEGLNQSESTLIPQLSETMVKFKEVNDHAHKQKAQKLEDERKSQNIRMYRELLIESTQEIAEDISDAQFDTVDASLMEWVGGKTEEIDGLLLTNEYKEMLKLLKDFATKMETNQVQHEIDEIDAEKEKVLAEIMKARESMRIEQNKIDELKRNEDPLLKDRNALLDMKRQQLASLNEKVKSKNDRELMLESRNAQIAKELNNLEATQSAKVSAQMIFARKPEPDQFFSQAPHVDGEGNEKASEKDSAKTQ